MAPPSCIIPLPSDEGDFGERRCGLRVRDLGPSPCLGVFLSLSWPHLSLQELHGHMGVFRVCVISGLLSTQVRYAAGHPIGAQSLMYVCEMVRAALQGWSLGNETLDKAEKKGVGMDLYTLSR